MCNTSNFEGVMGMHIASAYSTLRNCVFTTTQVVVPQEYIHLHHPRNIYTCRKHQEFATQCFGMGVGTVSLPLIHSFLGLYSCCSSKIHQQHTYPHSIPNSFCYKSTELHSLIHSIGAWSCNSLYLNFLAKSPFLIFCINICISVIKHLTMQQLQSLKAYSI